MVNFISPLPLPEPPRSPASSYSSSSTNRGHSYTSGTQTTPTADKIKKWAFNEMNIIANFLAAPGRDNDSKTEQTNIRLTDILKENINAERAGTNWLERQIKKVLSFFTGAPTKAITNKELQEKVQAFALTRLQSNIHIGTPTTPEDDAARGILLKKTQENYGNSREMSSRVDTAACKCLHVLNNLIQKEIEEIDPHSLVGRVTTTPPTSSATENVHAAFFNATWRK